MHFAMQSAPTGWLKADGSAVSRTQYPVLFAAIGTTFGVGDGRTTFNLPDLRGEFVRGWGDSRGVDRGRAFGCAAVLSAPCSAPASAAIACISLFYRPLQGRRNHVVH
ncbi:tail fiber protein [Neisseria elongata]|uniref:phage tail protein n=1 Tax=Neisseria elongata TaxID=495 RepID=UPI0036F417BA